MIFIFKPIIVEQILLKLFNYVDSYNNKNELNMFLTLIINLNFKTMNIFKAMYLGINTYIYIKKMFNKN